MLAGPCSWWHRPRCRWRLLVSCCGSFHSEHYWSRPSGPACESWNGNGQLADSWLKLELTKKCNMHLVRNRNDLHPQYFTSLATWCWKPVRTQCWFTTISSHLMSIFLRTVKSQCSPFSTETRWNRCFSPITSSEWLPNPSKL